MDSSKWNDHIVAQVYTCGILIIIMLAFKYLVMRNFQNHVDEFSTLLMSTEIDRKAAEASIVDDFQPYYYMHPDLMESHLTVGTVDSQNNTPEEEHVLLIRDYDI
jgi:hypothetical protein